VRVAPKQIAVRRPTATDNGPSCRRNGAEAARRQPSKPCSQQTGTAHAFHLTDPKLVNPLFDLAEEFRVPVIVHGAAELYNCPPEFAPMAARYPKVALLMAHMGYFASVGQAILFAREYPNLYLETSRVPLYEIQSAVRQLGGERVIWVPIHLMRTMSGSSTRWSARAAMPPATLTSWVAILRVSCVSENRAGLK
jgi:hypothetical protein